MPDPDHMVDVATLTEPERQLVDAVLAGESPLSGGERVRADVLRSLLLGRYGDLDPRGVHVRGVHVTGTLNLDSVTCTVPVSIARCVFDEPLQARGTHFSLLRISRSTLPGLHAKGLRVDRDLILSAGFTVTTSDDRGAVRLFGVHVGGQLNVSGAHLENTAGPALILDNARVDGGILMGDGFTATGHGDDGAVRMVDAQVGGQVDLTGATLTNPSGSALVANRIAIKGDLFLRGAFSAHGNSGKSLIRLNSATVGGIEFEPGASLDNPGGIVLGLQNATVDWVSFPPDLLCDNHCDATGGLLLTGLRYTTLSKDGADWSRWLHWIRCHTTEYQAQPYRQLADVQRSAGHDAAARTILIVQQDDLRQRGDVGGTWSRLRHRLWGALAGYGYRAGRAATALVVALLLAGAIGWVAGRTPTHDGRFAALHTARAERPFTPCSTLELIGLGIDRGLPLGATGIRDRCDLDTATRAGQLFTAAIWLLQAIVWALATLVVAGYTGLVRKVT
jgi:hypothetical protein